MSKVLKKNAKNKETKNKSNLDKKLEMVQEIFDKLSEEASLVFDFLEKERHKDEQRKAGSTRN